MSSWICDGVPKNGQNYTQAKAGGHPQHENYGPDCEVCGLPQEAMEIKTRQVATTKIAGSGNTKRSTLPVLPLVLGGLLLVGLAAGWAGYTLFKPKSDPQIATTTPAGKGDFVSSNARNPDLFSQGEKILLRVTPDKQTAASSFARKDWGSAIANFRTSAQANDPEAKIYFNNSQARQTGNPLTIAVVVPITTDPNGSQEVLRGVAKYQEEFNQRQTGRPLEVVIVNDVGQLKTAEIAEDILQAPTVLGVLGHGIDPFSQQAISRYQDGGLAVLSPLTTSISEGSQPTLKTIGLDDKNNELLGNYLKSVSTTLAQYASQQKPNPVAAIFYNSDSPYSQQLKEQLSKALPKVKGQVVQSVDTTKAGFDAEKAIKMAKSQGANVMFLALSKDSTRVDQALAIARANSQGSSPLLLLGGNELYNPDILIKGGDSISGLVLAVPWSFQPTDPFARDAIKSWKGRVSWRTATAYDATKMLAQTLEKNPDRQDTNQAFQQGVPLSGNATNFNVFTDVPLVKAIPGTSGPAGSKYQFEPLR